MAGTTTIAKRLKMFDAPAYIAAERRAGNFVELVRQDERVWLSIGHPEGLRPMPIGVARHFNAERARDPSWRKKLVDLLEAEVTAVTG